ncbi:MAG: hypothetical protein AAF204_00225 [Pseudomonadota bacterium]
MLDGLYSALNTSQSLQSQNIGVNPPARKKVLRMVESERMGGSVPVWEYIEAPATKIEAALTQAVNDEAAQTPESALAYNGNLAAQATPDSDEFGFGDLVDMVNPLHHVPVVGHIYRELTGDQIKPIGNIVGGALYGGALGAASGLVNAIAIQETGKDLTGNAMALALNGEMPSLRGQEDAFTNDDPEIRLARATDQNIAPKSQADALPGNLLAFVDMSAPKSNAENIVIKRVNTAEGRTAGTTTMATKQYPDIQEMPTTLREPITQVRFNAYRTNN